MGLGANVDLSRALRQMGSRKAAKRPTIPDCLSGGIPDAMALAPGLAATIGEAGLAQLTMGACGPAIGAARFEDGSKSRYPRAFAENCIRFNDNVLDILVRNWKSK